MDWRGRVRRAEQHEEKVIPMELPSQRIVKKEEVKEEEDEPLDSKPIIASGGEGAAGEEAGGRAPEDDVIDPALPLELPHQRAVKNEEVGEEDDEPIEKRARIASGGGGGAGQETGGRAPENPAAPAKSKRAEHRDWKKEQCREVYQLRAAVEAATEETLHDLLHLIESFTIRSTVFRAEACASLCKLAMNLPEKVLRAYITRSQLACLLVMVLETSAAVAQAATSALYKLAPLMGSHEIANLIMWRTRWEGNRAHLNCPPLDLVQSVVQSASRAWPGHAAVLLSRGRHFLGYSSGEPGRIHAALNLIVFSLRVMGPMLPLNFEERRHLAQELRARLVDRQLAPLLYPVVVTLNAGGWVM